MGAALRVDAPTTRAAARPSQAQQPLRGEPCRFDLREYACVPYPPVENQGNDVTCVAHAFAMALYCGVLRNRRDLSRTLSFPNFEEIFKKALEQSPDKARGVAFEAVAAGARAGFAAELAELDAEYRELPNSAAALRAALLRGSPVIVGYQVNHLVDSFHRDSSVCRASGYMLPSHGAASTPLSGHAVLILGYDFGVQAFIARNSWGPSWGVDGHFLIPFTAVEDRDVFTDVWALMAK